MLAFALMVLLLVVVLGMGYMFSRSVESIATSRPDPAIEEFRIAYARGDLTREEFRERRKDLRGNPVSPRPNRTVPVNRIRTSGGDHGDEGVQGVDSGVPIPLL